MASLKGPVLLALIAASSASKLEFGVFDGEDPGLDRLNHAGGWKAADLATLNKFRAQFVQQYNSNQGLKVINDFTSKNCCFSLKGGTNLVISGSKYGQVFPASATGKLTCNEPTYKDHKLQFYGVSKFTDANQFSENSKCQKSHNPTIFVREVPEVSADQLEFGMFDSTVAPGDRWQLMSVSDFTTYKLQFVSSYNQNGISAIKPFKSGSCCFAVKGGESLVITGTKYGFQFPSSTTNSIRCNPTAGYLEPAYKFYNAQQLSLSSVFSSKKYCPVSHNPAVYMRLPQKAVAAAKFGVYLFNSSPGAGWKLMTMADVATNKASFIAEYNKNAGFPVLGSFKTGNCCFALAGGKKLHIGGSAYGYQFPATSKGAIRCNPSAGYTKNENLQFYRTPTLSRASELSAVSACATNNNPGIYMFVADVSKKEFGMGNVATTPAGGWKLITNKQLGEYRDVFVHQYNAQGGLNVIAPFTSDNCCVAIAGGETLTITGTTYGYQFPSQGGDLRCNPSLGYKGKYAFYGVSVIQPTMALGSKVACKISSNPAVFIRDALPPTPPPAPPTPAPPTHCKVSAWSTWSTCSVSCGVGSSTRSRTVVTKSQNGGDDCPQLEETQKCLIEDCPVHCSVGDWAAWSECDAKCGGGMKTRTRTVATAPMGKGDKCPHLQETEICNSFACIVHCKVSAWTPYSKCSADCSGGVQTRTRAVLLQNSFDGTPCPKLEESLPCNTKPCATNCVVSAWGTWSKCSAECGGGHQLRKRTIQVSSAFGGAACPSLVESKVCNPRACAIHCQVSKWSQFSACSKTCGGGTKTRSRDIVKLNKFGGEQCPELTQVVVCLDDTCPVDCVVGDWNKEWSTCSNLCGGGVQSRSRPVLRVSKFGGKVCPTTLQTQTCNSQACTCPAGFARKDQNSGCTACPANFFKAIAGNDACRRCPVDHWTANKSGATSCTCNAVDCTVGAYGKYGTCSKSCGSGIQTRTRKITQAHNSCGKPCPALQQSRFCKKDACPVDCLLGKWSSWSTCSKSCAGGTQTRSAGIAVSPMHGGKACPSSSQTRSCNPQACPVDCKLTPFASWSSCSKSCGVGVRSRSRSLLSAAVNGGKACGELTGEQRCDAGACPSHCSVSAWGEWSKCTKTCGAGEQKRVRTVVSKSDKGGYVCPKLTDERSCGDVACPVDCVMGAWQAWGSCSASCGVGAQTRYRTISKMNTNGGKSCPTSSEKKACNTDACPVDCVVTPFGAWSTCSKTCGSGTMARYRSVRIAPAFGGAKCPSLGETKTCNTDSCPVDCVVSGFTTWSACTKECNGGTQTRRRSVNVEPAFGGKLCPTLFATRKCNTKVCTSSPTVFPTRSPTASPTAPITEVIDCLVTSWDSWSGCNAPCGTGVQTRMRKIHVAPLNGGARCPSLIQKKDCEIKKCPIDCQADFTEWTTCTKTCGTGLQTRSVKKVYAEAQHGGKACATQERVCNYNSCPVDCVLSKFGPFLKCSQTCGSGWQIRRRSVKVPSSYGGKVCGRLSEGRECSSAACPVDCVLSAWGSWSTCSKSCGTGTQTREKTAVVKAAFGGKACQSQLETRSCSAISCPVDCEVSNWGAYDSCSKSCGGGVAIARRSVTRAALYGGKPCPSLTTSLSCNTPICPIDCVASSWSSWSVCAKTCGGDGLKTRTRTATAAKFGGHKCGALKETAPCSSGPCPVHCEVSGWSTYGLCSQTCGSGRKLRTRSIVTEAKNSGVRCPNLSSYQVCNPSPCPVDCQVSAFGSWSTCSTTCGGGVQIRSRAVTKNPYFGGKACAALEATKICAAQACPQDCVLSVWGEWGACSKTCASGTATRVRSVVTTASNGGRACATRNSSKKCNEQACPIDCVVGKFGTWSSCSATCNGGLSTRTRAATRKAQFGGQDCPALVESRACNSQCCSGHVLKNGKCTKCLAGQFQDSAHCSFCPTGKFSTAMGMASCTSCAAGSAGRDGRGWTKTGSSHGNSNEAHCAKCAAGTYAEKDGSSKCVHCASGTFQSGLGGLSCTKCEAGKYTRNLAGQNHCVHVPVDCKVSEWGSWSQCSATCGSSFQERFRTITTKPLYGGGECPTLLMSQVCTVARCPVDCVVSSYSAWSACSKSCGSGIRTKTRKIQVNTLNGGKACPVLSQLETCNTQSCPVDCKLTPFSSFGPCTKTCGGGQQFRKRDVVNTAKFGGKPCQSLVDSKLCLSKDCPANCAMSGWSIYGRCSKSCGVGTTSKFRSVITEAAHGGAVCGSAMESKACDSGPCPIHCQVSAWGTWSKCTKTCGGGVRKRVRAIERTSKHGGYVCPSLEDTQSCGANKCPVHCLMSTWSKFSACSKTCGSGVQVSTRRIIEDPLHGGLACGDLKRSKACTLQQACPIDCAVSKWEPWTTCSRTCGIGGQIRRRTITTKAANGGVICPVLSQQQTCNHSPCPVDCEVAGWAAWSTCTQSCGGGEQHRLRRIIKVFAFGGTRCPALEQKRECNPHNCAINCVLDDWTAWSACSHSCGNADKAVHTRTRALISSAHYGGKACGKMQETKACNNKPCPVDCVLSTWSAWTVCTVTCGGGSMERTRIIKTPAANGGACGTLHDKRTCVTQPCPIHCSVGTWSGWTKCSKSCGGGAHKRTRQIVKHAAHGGYACPALVNEQACNSQVCAVDCQISTWSAWSACTRTCDNGNDLNRVAPTRHRTRSVIKAANHGGKLCSSFTKVSVEKCNNFRCPLDCAMSEWTSFGACSATCGVAVTKSRTRTVHYKARFGGSCGKTEDAQNCKLSACPVHCAVSEWSAWSTCTKTCGTGTQSSHRSVLTQAKFGGNKCPTNAKYQTCGHMDCPVDCKVTEWTAFTQCSVSCGQGGFKRSTRTITTQSKSGGKMCPPIVKMEACNRHQCPVDCQTTKWSKWGHFENGAYKRECSNKCGFGKQTRSRKGLTRAKFGGRECGNHPHEIPIEVEQNCEGLECAVHCKTSEWTAFTKCSAVCGGGVTTRKRSVISHAKHGGYSCPVLFVSKQCNDQPCPVDCTTTDWSAYTTCSHTCGDKGEQWRLRRIVKPALYGGSCVSLKEKKTCGGSACPVDCVQTAQWGEWSLCSKACGAGFKKRERLVVRKAAHGGKPCSGVEKVPCQVKECGCSHVRCEMRKTLYDNDLAVVVKHHKLEKMGNHHVCKFNHKYQDCECVCKQR